MITVECPYCGKDYILNLKEIKKLTIGGKVVITDCNCGCNRMFVVEDDGDCIFSHKQYIKGGG